MCGDVDCNVWILAGDANDIFDVAGDVMDPSELKSQWAADVDCNKWILAGDANDVFDVAGDILEPSALSCCNGCES